MKDIVNALLIALRPGLNRSADATLEVERSIPDGRSTARDCYCGHTINYLT
jgi:hypothetical protein